MVAGAIERKLRRSDGGGAGAWIADQIGSADPMALVVTPRSVHAADRLHDWIPVAGLAPGSIVVIEQGG